MPGIAAACSLYIVLIMTLMCLIMYRNQRKKAYLNMIIAFLFIMAYEGLNIHFTLSQGIQPVNDHLWTPRLQVFSFLLLNVSIYQLYRRVRIKGYLLLGLMIFLLMVPIFTKSLLPFESSSWQMLYLDIYQCVIIIMGFFIIYPRIRQRGKYVIGIIIYLLWIITNMLIRYMENEAVWLQTPSLFLPLIYYTMIFFILFERIIEQMQSIYRSSITDGLTNLYNRRFFMKNVNRYVEQGVKVSVIFCDIDNFKKLNDTQGHAKADQVLKQVSAIIDEEVSEIGLSGRYGGEELVAALVDKRAKVSQVAESIRVRVESETIVTISVGYSTLRKNVTADELVSQADQAMYRSKTTGKNKVSPFHAPSSKKDAINT
ncbi:GGDEF domain-containing protein [Paenibacillus sp. IHBB 10380]|uniref:GGDEF domain-containing protein n=1 Tax=Paenibacillus sp. IHBB 10380 TaxID=1566358 RepID=UPI000AA25DF6|nr:GGDEF domain-containing protein [Paenibacillus sp. IHBB 10380]